MSAACGSCGATRPELPPWTLMVPVILGAASLALIVVFRGRVSGRILAGVVTLGFVGFSAWLALQLRTFLSARCPKCGRRPE